MTGDYAAQWGVFVCVARVLTWSARRDTITISKAQDKQEASMLTNIEVAFYAGGDNESGSVSFVFNGESQELDWSINKYGEVVTDREDTHALGLDDGDVVEIESEIEAAVQMEKECED